MNRLILISTLALPLLAACGHAPAPRIETHTVTVQVPVPVPCAVDVPDPIYSDTDEALRNAPDLFERVKLLLAGRVERDAHDQTEKAARAACNG